jgi:predicted transcriptional regulator
MLQKIVYLDQNIWINLAQVYYGVKNDVDILNLCEVILKKLESNDLIIPLSVVHLIEAHHIQDNERRDRLIEFMLKVSRGNTIIPFNNNKIEAEIRQAICKRIEHPTLDLKDCIIGKGIQGIFGGRLTLEFPKRIKKGQLKQMKDLEEKSVEWLESTEALSLVSKNHEIFEEIKDKENSKLINEIEKIRSEYNKVKDKKLRDKVFLLKNFEVVVSPRITKICTEIGISEESVFLDTWTEEDWMNFIKEIPSFYILFNLSYWSEKNFNRPIQENDLNDVYSLTISIPYCDIIVCEKMFASIAKHTKLDKIYSTNILTSIGELEQFI